MKVSLRKVTTKLHHEEMVMTITILSPYVLKDNVKLFPV